MGRKVCRVPPFLFANGGIDPNGIDQDDEEGGKQPKIAKAPDVPIQPLVDAESARARTFSRQVTIAGISFDPAPYFGQRAGIENFQRGAQRRRDNRKANGNGVKPYFVSRLQYQFRHVVADAQHEIGIQTGRVHGNGRRQLREKALRGAGGGRAKAKDDARARGHGQGAHRGRQRLQDVQDRHAHQQAMVQRHFFGGSKGITVAVGIVATIIIIIAVVAGANGTARVLLLAVEEIDLVYNRQRGNYRT